MQQQFISGRIEIFEGVAKIIVVCVTVSVRKAVSSEEQLKLDRSFNQDK